MVRGRLGSALNDFRRLWDAGTVSGLSDARLLEQFRADRDELAFDALMSRHGPLVWSVCRSILNDPHDVEDAFQATFLILVRKAPSLRVGDSLCGWLYRVSFRAAQEARVRRDRRRSRERSVVDRIEAAGDADRARDELLGILSLEIDRLPEKYRLPIVLCGLEGLTRQQAAGQLGWPPGTVATRLARGQDLLHRRMRRRLGDDAVGLSGWLGGLVSATVPAACREATTRVAMTLAGRGWGAAGLGSSAFVLARGVHGAMVQESVRSVVFLALGLALTTWAASGWLRHETGQEPSPADLARRLSFAASAREPVTIQVEPGRVVRIRGRLTDRMSGKAIRGKVFYAPLKGNPNGDGIPGQAENSSVSDEDGRFAVTGLPGRGLLVVTAGTDDALLYPRLREASPEDRQQGFALPDDEAVLDALPRPVSLIGSHAYKVVDIPEGRGEFEIDFALAVHPGRTVTVRVVDPAGEPLKGVRAFGVREPRLAGSKCIRGDGPFAVQDLDAAWPRRVMFLQPERDLAGFLDLTGNEPVDVTARLSPCGSIVGRVVDRADAPIAGALFRLVYDDGQALPHIAFPSGRWVPTRDEAIRDQRTHADPVPINPVNVGETSSEDGRFRIRHVVPGARYHLRIIINQAGRRLGLKAPPHRGKKLLMEGTLSAGQALDLGDVRILPEELSIDR
jgi:RNA polymerase sigma factor (sigma-70 family)